MSRYGVLKQKKGKTSIHFNGDSMNTELLFQTEDEKGRASTAADNKILTKLKQEEVQPLVCPPKRATGNRMPRKESRASKN